MFDSSLQQILAELERVDLLLRVQVWRARQGRGEAGELAAFYIPDSEADELLDKTIGAPVWAGVPLPPDLTEAVQTRMDQLTLDIAEHTTDSLSHGVPLRLVALAALFGLSDIDLDIVLLCLAPELDRGYERLYAYLHDDLTRRQPTVDLALNLFCADLASKVAARTRLTAAAPLRRFRILELGEEPDLLNASMRLEPRVVSFLLGDDTVDDRLASCTTLATAEAGIDGLVFESTFRAQLKQLTQLDRDAGFVLYFQGSHGSGRRSAAAACCHALSRPLLVVAGQRLAAASADEFMTLVHLIDREARMQGALLLWEDFDALLAEPAGPDSPAGDHARLTELFAVLQALPGPVFLTGTQAWEPAGPLRDRPFLRIQFPQPGAG